MPLTRIELDRFTAFESLDFRPGPGINVLVGANGTGKTHLMKVAYAACDITRSQLGFADKLVRTFLPSGRALGRLVKRSGKSATARVEVRHGEAARIGLGFSSHAKDPSASKLDVKGVDAWSKLQIESAFIPVKEMLSHGPGFRSLYSRREIHFDEIYADILDRAYLSLLRGPTDAPRERILSALQEAIDGKVTVKNEEFFLRNTRGDLEFTLLSEGMRKLGLLWVLVQNGTLLDGSVLFWDEPEANLNPKTFGTLTQVLMQLQRLGVQVFLATHDYALLKELELATERDDRVDYFALYRAAADDEIVCEHATEAPGLSHSPIAEAMDSLYDRQVARSFGAMTDAQATPRKKRKRATEEA